MIQEEEEIITALVANAPRFFGDVPVRGNDGGGISIFKNNEELGDDPNVVPDHCVLAGVYHPAHLPPDQFRLGIGSLHRCDFLSGSQTLEKLEALCRYAAPQITEMGVTDSSNIEWGGREVRLPWLTVMANGQSWYNAHGFRQPRFDEEKAEWDRVRKLTVREAWRSGDNKQTLHDQLQRAWWQHFHADLETLTLEKVAVEMQRTMRRQPDTADGLLAQLFVDVIASTWHLFKYTSSPMTKRLYAADAAADAVGGGSSSFGAKGRRSGTTTRRRIRKKKRVAIRTRRSRRRHTK